MGFSTICLSIMEGELGARRDRPPPTLCLSWLDTPHGLGGRCAWPPQNCDALPRPISISWHLRVVGRKLSLLCCPEGIRAELPDLGGHPGAGAGALVPVPVPVSVPVPVPVPEPAPVPVPVRVFMHSTCRAWPRDMRMAVTGRSPPRSAPR